MIKVLSSHSTFNFGKVTTLTSALAIFLLSTNFAHAQTTTSNLSLTSGTNTVTTTAGVGLASLSPIQQLGYRLKISSDAVKQEKASSLAGLPFTASNLFDTGISNFYNEAYLRDFIQPKENLKAVSLLGSPNLHVTGELRSNAMLGAYRQQANLYDLNFNLIAPRFKIGVGFTISDYHYVIPTSPNLVSKNYNKGIVLLDQVTLAKDIALTYQFSYQYFNNKVNRKYALFDKPYSFNHDYNQHDLTNAFFVSKNFHFNLLLPNQVITPFFGGSYTYTMLPLVTENLGGYKLEVAKQDVNHYDLLSGLTYGYSFENFNVTASYSFRYQLNSRKALESKLTDDKTTIPLSFKTFDQRYEQVFGLKASYTYKLVTIGGQVTLMDYIDYESSYGVFVKVSY